MVGGRKRAKTQSELSTGVRVIRLALSDSAPTIETGGKTMTSGALPDGCTATKTWVALGSD